ncbi:MAG: zinc ribbon domain-containing protein [Myxococcales bacterium]|nr:zinc ribbon domain-containing protein [Myxococcales bacterium]
MAVCGTLESRAGAQEVSYTGAWQASPLSVRYALQSWGPDCGPRPGSSSEPGGRVTISAEGSHLRFSGAVSGSTNACWSDNAEVRRVSASARGESWSASCATVAGNPRGESGRYTYTVRDANTLGYSERTTYNWQLRESTCTATRTATRTLTRAVPLAVPSELPPPPAELPPPTPVATPEPTRACTPGDPTTLRLRVPEEGPFEPGARVCLAVRVADAAGCALPNPRIEWRVAGPPGTSGRMDGRCFVTTANAAEAEGAYEITATAGTLEARAEVTVRTPDLSGLIAVRDRETGEHTGGIDRAESEHASGVAAITSGGRGRLPLLIGVGLLLLGATCGFALLVLRVRRRPAPQRTATSDEPSDRTSAPPPKLRPANPLENSGTALIPQKAALPPVARPDPAADPAARARAVTLDAPPEASAAPAAAQLGSNEPVSCPVCGAPGTGGERFCAKHGERLVPHGSNPLRTGGMICPTCRRGYPADAEFCPHDGAVLVPYTLYRRQDTTRDALPRICPSCGERYAQHVTFCGKDGSSLTTVN